MPPLNPIAPALRTRHPAATRRPCARWSVSAVAAPRQACPNFGSAPVVFAFTQVANFEGGSLPKNVHTPSIQRAHPKHPTCTPQASQGIKKWPADKVGPHSAQPTKAVHKALHKARPGPQTGWSQSRFRRSHGWSWPAAAQSTARSGCPSPQSSAAAYRWL